MKKLLLFLMVFLLPKLASADDSGNCGDGLSYFYVEATHTLTISKIDDGKGCMDNYSNYYYLSPWNSYKTEILQIIIEEGVTSIGDYAFYECSDLTSIVIPKCVTSIGRNAFESCRSLTSIILPEALNSIGNHAFAECSSLTSIILPEALNSIGNYAFYECSSLTSIILPEALNSIGYGIFSGCSGISSIIIPKNVISIGEQAFFRCNDLTSIVIPESVTSIGNHAFAECSSLTSITIPNSVVSIGDAAFRYCSGLISITIPNSIKSIGNFAFAQCSSLTSITIPNNIKSIGDGTYANCVGLTSITIPDGVTSIGNSAFQGCRGLYSMVIPNSVTSLGERVFYSCVELTTVTLPENLKHIKTEIFTGCKKLTNITIPASVEIIYQKAFLNCFSLQQIIALPTTPPFIYDKTFSNYSVLLIVPSGCVNAYKDADYWKNFSKITDGTKYKLTYIVDDEEYKTVEIEAGVSITPESEPTKEGYTFSGWSEIPSTMPEKDVAITGTFTINNYKLIYMVDGIDYQTYEVEFGAIIPPNDVPTKEGYTFSGWSEIPETMPANDVTVTGSFTINKYKLTYLIDGVEFKSYEIEYNASITPETAPTKDGYSFSGWSEIPETMPDQDVLVNGSFTINKYKLTYIVDGEEYKSYEIEYNSNITPEVAPTKDGYTFSGWSEIPETMPAKDVIVTGSFERVYEVKDIPIVIDKLLRGNIDDEDIALYDMNGDGELNIGDLILIMRAINNGANRSAINRAAANNQTIELSANNVTMKPGETTALDVSLSNSTNGIYGIQYELQLPEGFSLEKGWNDKLYKMSGNQADDMICSDLDLGNGVHRFLVYSATLQELKGGDLMSFNLKADDAQTLGDYIVSISNVVLSDYDGQVTKEDGMSVGVKVINSFTLLYKVDGEDYKSYEVEYGSTISPEAEPTKEGYIFSGWSEIPTTMPAEDVIVTGTFTVKQFILTYVVDGTVYKDYCYDYGSSIVPEAEPTKEGYTFSGWSEIPETMPANEVYVVGTFTINKYKITYMIDGEVYRTEEVEYGAEIQTPTPETHDGFDFEWSDVPTTMPANDIVIYGTYSSTGIKAIVANETDVKIFTVSGKPLNKLQKGVNIIRTRDGKTRKIVVK